MLPCIPFFINHHQFVILHAIFLSIHMLCAMLGASCIYFLICLVLFLFSIHNKLDPSLPCLGEKHDPLLPRMLIVFMLIFVQCSLLFQVVVMSSSCFSCLSL